MAGDAVVACRAMGKLRSAGEVLLVAVLVLLTPSARVSAQSTDCRELAPPAEGDTTSAQRTAIEAFSRGSRATEEERWDAAEQCFAMAFRLSHVALARYNQAVALRALGRPIEARVAFDEAIAAGLDAERATQAASMRSEVAADVSTLRVEGIALDVDAEIELDGDPVPREASAVTSVECDPGRHTLVVRAPGYQPFTWSGDVVAGTSASVSVTLDPIPSGGAGVLEEPWFWIVVGVVVVGASVGVGVWAQDQAQLRGEAPAGFVVQL